MHKEAIFIPGPSGELEAVVHYLDTPVTCVGIICHPNPLQQGTMENKVVTTVARSFNEMGITAIRFNYRGVGRSQGEFGNIEGEVADCMAVVAWVQQQWPQAKLWFAGFSFGAYIAAAAASQVPTQQLISIAPAVERMPYTSLSKISCPWLVIQGEADEVVDPAAVYAWFEQLDANKILLRMPETGHFFHGKLIDLRREIEFLTSSNIT